VEKKKKKAKETLAEEENNFTGKQTFIFWSKIAKTKIYFLWSSMDWNRNV